MKGKEKTNRKSDIILEINRFYRTAGKYGKIILNGKSGSRQKAEAIKSFNLCVRKISKLTYKLLDKDFE